MVEGLERRELLAVSIAEFSLPAAGSRPAGIILGPDGNLWFTEGGTSQIGVINPTTHAIQEFPTPTPSSDPSGITVGPDGNIWFTETAANQIGEIDPTTHAIQEFPIPNDDSKPTGIVAGPNDTLWLTESNAAQVSEFSLTDHSFGTDVSTTSTGVSGPGAIAAGPDGNLWFTDGNEVGLLNLLQNNVTEFPIPASGNALSGIAAGPDGNVWFTETGSAGKVGEINPTTHTVTDFPVPAAGSSPQGIAVGPDDNLWFTDPGTNEIGEINPTTHAISESPVPTAGSFPDGITAGPDAALWFTENLGNKIGRAALPVATKAGTSTQLTSDNNPSVADQLVTFTAVVTPAAGSTLTPSGSVTFTVDGQAKPPVRLAVVNGVDRATLAVAFSTGGTHTLTAAYGGDFSFTGSPSNTVNQQVSTPSPVSITEFPDPVAKSVVLMMTPGPDGNLWFTDPVNMSVGVVNPTTHAVTEFPLPATSNPPNFITAGPDGNLWFTESTSGTFGVINPATHAITEFSTPVTSDLSAITAGPDGNLWFIDSGNVGEVNPSTHAATVFPAPASGSKAITITAGPDGNLWFTDSGTHSIGVINPTTHAITEFPIPASGSFPIFIAAGSDGNLWFADPGTRSIGVIRPTTHAITEFPLPDNGTIPFLITAGPDGNLWFTLTAINAVGSSGPASIGKISPTTHAITEFSVPASSDTTVSAAAGPDGALWFTTLGTAGTSPTTLLGRIAFSPATPTATTTQLSSSDNPATVGQSVTYTAVVTPAAGSTGTPGGSVTFTVDGQAKPAVALAVVGGKDEATLAVTFSAAGPHTVSAAYGGDASFAASSSNTVNQTVSPATPTATTTQLSSSANPATVGQSVTYTAVVTPAAGSTGTPTGNVVFAIDGQVRTPVALVVVNGKDEATLAVTFPTAGPHTVTASYGGGGGFSGGQSNAVTQQVNATGPPSTTTQGGTLGAAVVGLTVLEATVSAAAGSSGTPTGAVDFYDATTEEDLGLGTLNRGQALLSDPGLIAGPHTIIATYGGDPTFPGSSGRFSLNVQKAQPAVTLTATAAAVAAGQPVTFTVVVTPPAPPLFAAGRAVRAKQAATTAPEPIGGVTLLDGNTVLVNYPLPAPPRIIYTTALAPGVHTIRAVYSGDPDYLATPSNPVTVTVAAPAPVDGPRVVGVLRFGYHTQPTVLVVGFTAPLNPLSAQFAPNYVIIGPAGGLIPVVGASYNPLTDSVTLLPAKPLNLHYTYLLVINGMGPFGVQATTGLLLDGLATGRPGSDYVTTLTAANLVVPNLFLPGALAALQLSYDARLGLPLL